MNYSPYNFGRLISLIDRKMKSFHSVALERFGLSVSEMPFFLTLTRKDGVSQDELTQWVGVDKALTARAVRSLENKGFVVRKRSEEDRRKQCVYLTENAWNIAEEVMDASVSPNKVLSSEIGRASCRERVYLMV